MAVSVIVFNTALPPIASIISTAVTAVISATATVPPGYCALPRGARFLRLVRIAATADRCPRAAGGHAVHERVTDRRRTRDAARLPSTVHPPALAARA